MLAQLEWKKKRARDLEWNVGCYEGAYGRQEEHLACLEAEIRILKTNDARNNARSADPRSPISSASSPKNRWILPTRAPTPGIARPTTDLANLPGRPAFTGLPTPGTKSQPSTPIFSSIPQLTISESNAGPRPLLFGTRLPQTTTENQAASRPSLFDLTLPGNHARSIFGREVTPTETTPASRSNLFGNPLSPNAPPRGSAGLPMLDQKSSRVAQKPSQLGDATLSAFGNIPTSITTGHGLSGPNLLTAPNTWAARPRDSVSSFTPHHRTTGLFRNNPLSTSSTGTTTGFNILSGGLKNRVPSGVPSPGSISFNPPLSAVPSSLLTFEQLEEIHVAKL